MTLRVSRRAKENHVGDCIDTPPQCGLARIGQLRRSRWIVLRNLAWITGKLGAAAWQIRIPSGIVRVAVVSGGIVRIGTSAKTVRWHGLEDAIPLLLKCSDLLVQFGGLPGAPAERLLLAFFVNGSVQRAKTVGPRAAVSDIRLEHVARTGVPVASAGGENVHRRTLILLGPALQNAVLLCQSKT